jgi:SAM-dependent methyltransferase
MMPDVPSTRSSATPWEDIAPLMFDAMRWEEATGEVERAISLLALSPPATILDLACGPGRHALELARRGFRVTGVDVTAPFLDQARGLAAAEGLRLELVRADMREFERPEAFDAVINLSTSFGYFSDPNDDRRVLAHVRRSLRPTGVLLMELMSREVITRAHRSPERLREGDVVLTTEQVIRDDGTWVDHRLHLAAGAAERGFVLSHRLFSSAELEALLSACAFGSVRVYGDLGGSPFDDRATRLVAVARP